MIESVHSLKEGPCFGELCLPYGSLVKIWVRELPPRQVDWQENIEGYATPLDLVDRSKQLCTTSQNSPSGKIGKSAFDKCIE